MVVNLIRFSRFLFQETFHHSKEKFSYNRGAKRCIPFDNWELLTGTDIVTVDPWDIGEYGGDKDQLRYILIHMQYYTDEVC